MKAVRFDEIVVARANERVQQKILAFKIAIKKACGDLVGYPYNSYALNEKLHKNYRGVLAIMLNDNISVGWPSTLWDMEREKVSTELLNIMDEMQKALLAADRGEPGENVPCNT